MRKFQPHTGIDTPQDLAHVRLMFVPRSLFSMCRYKDYTVYFILGLKFLRSKHDSALGLGPYLIWYKYERL